MNVTENSPMARKIADIRDTYGVALWRMVGDVMLITMDDGDQVEVAEDGSLNWINS